MISPTRQELVSSLVQYVSNATGLAASQVIRGNQNSPSPTGPYASVLYVNDVPYGTGAIEITSNPDDDNTLKYSIRRTQAYQFNLQFFRENATDYAKLVMQYHLTPPGMEFIQQSPFSFRQVDAVNENAQIIDQNFENRAILILRLWVTESQPLLVNRVCSVSVDQTVTDGVVDIADQYETCVCETLLADNDSEQLLDNDGTPLQDNAC